jgi:uncharacterized protein YecE (DUF72 family)
VRAKLPASLQQKSPLVLDDLSPALRMELWDCLNTSMSVFHRAGKLGAVLFQFPLGFMDTPQNRYCPTTTIIGVNYKIIK